MISIPTMLVLGVVGGVFTLIPAGMSVFSKNQKVNKILFGVGIACFTALTLLLTLPLFRLIR